MKTRRAISKQNRKTPRRGRPAVPETSLIYVNRSQPDLPWHMHRHSHPFHEIVLILRGCERARIGNEDMEAHTGDLLVYRADTLHEEWSGNCPLFESCYAGFEANLPDALPVLLHDHGGRIRTLMTWMLEDGRIPYDNGSPAVLGVLCALVGQLSRLPVANPHEMTGIVRRYVRDHIAEPISLEDLAGEARLSKYYFLRQYTRLAGRSPMTDVRLLRLERAKELIVGTSLPFKEIAAQSGLCDVYRMNRLFRKHLGRTPGQLRRCE